MQAYGDLLRRYRETLSYAWKDRASHPSNLFNEQEAEFMPGALAIQEMPVSRTARLTAWILISTLLCLLVWSILGKMDIAVNAKGKVIPSSYTKTISSVEVAAVDALYVKEGDFVKAGQVLVDLDSVSSESEHDKATATFMDASLQAARCIAMIEAMDGGRRPVLPVPDGAEESLVRKARTQLDDQYADFEKKKLRIEGEIRRYELGLALAAKVAQDYRALVDSGDVSNHAWIDKEQAKTEKEGQLNDARNQRFALVAQTRKEAWDQLTEARKTIIANAQDARRAEGRSKLMRLRSPVDGTVQQLTLHTVGGVVPAAQPLMAVVPVDTLVEVEAMIENKDIGFVHVGQLAYVKIETFDYTRYGVIPGTVVQVSKDAIKDDSDEKRGMVYSVKVALDRATLKVDEATLPISAGMTATIEIKTGERRVISYMLSPLLQHQREALNER
jgi:hemolysin D